MIGGVRMIQVRQPRGADVPTRRTEVKSTENIGQQFSSLPHPTLINQLFRVCRILVPRSDRPASSRIEHCLALSGYAFLLDARGCTLENLFDECQLLHLNFQLTN